MNGYGQLTFRFAQRWAVGGRYEYGSPAVDTDGDEVIDDLDPEWTGGRHRLAANVTFFPTEFSRLRLQGASDMPTWEPDPIWRCSWRSKW